MHFQIYSLMLCLVIFPYTSGAIPRKISSLLETTNQISTFSQRNSADENKTTESHLGKGDGSKKPPAIYTRLPPHVYCKGRSAVAAGDQDLDNKPSTTGHPLPGQSAGYILCSAIKKPNTSKHISIYLVKPKSGKSNQLDIHALNINVVPDNYDAEDDKSFSYHYNMTLPSHLKGKWTFYLLETYDIFEPRIENLILTQSFPFSVGS